jgi:DNA (cytosine-5)-methyltransferase 1
LIKKKNLYTFIDLFAGAGGLSEGFLNAGFSPVAHIENDEAACYTLKTRAAYHFLKRNQKLWIYESYLKGHISRDALYGFIPKRILDQVINKKIGVNKNKKLFSIVDKLKGNKDIDVIIGGPPCQAYSVIGRAVDKKKMKNDSRNFLYIDYGRFLTKYKPRIFIFENVLGLLSANGKKRKYVTNMLSYFKKIGYNVEYKILNASEFGVLQNRKRMLIIGWQKDINFSYPEFEKIVHNCKVKNIFSDLPAIRSGQGKEKNGKYKNITNEYLKDFYIRNGIEILSQHVSRPNTEKDLKIYAYVVKIWNEDKKRLNYSELPDSLISHKNTIDFIDRFKIVASELPTSQTILAHIAKDGHYYIHPSLKQNRSISVREAARLQSFPDDYYFEGEKENKNRTAAYKQIGNAVPPLMSKSIAIKIKKMLFTCP